MPTAAPLAALPMVAFVAARDPARAMEFYLRVTVVKELAPAPYTVLGWETPGIAATAAVLRTAGVQLLSFTGHAAERRRRNSA